jgi:hypothetical protein
MFFLSLKTGQIEHTGQDRTTTSYYTTTGHTKVRSVVRGVGRSGVQPCLALLNDAGTTYGCICSNSRPFFYLAAYTRSGHDVAGNGWR